MISLTQALENAKLVKEGDEWTDLLTFVHLFHSDGKQGVVAMPGDTGESLWAAVGEICVTARVAEGPLDSVLFLTDARMRTLAEGEERPENDNLQEKWQAGDKDGITETLILHIMHSDGSMESAMQPYDADARTWGEPTIVEKDSDITVGGGIVDALRLAVADIDPDGNKADELADFIANAHRNPLLRAVARRNRGEEIDIAQIMGEVSTTDMEEAAARIAEAHPEPPAATNVVSIAEYLEERDAGDPV